MATIDVTDGWEYRAKIEGSTIWEAGVYDEGTPLLVLDMPTPSELLLLKLLCAVPPLLRGARAMLAYDKALTPDDVDFDEFIAAVARLSVVVPKLDALIAAEVRRGLAHTS